MNRTDPHVSIIFRAFEMSVLLRKLKKNRVEACRSIKMLSLRRVNSVFFKMYFCASTASGMWGKGEQLAWQCIMG